MIRALLVIAAASLAACTAAAPPPPPPTAGMVETIRYETGPCFGACPVYTLTVSSDGRGVFEGRRHTAVAGIRNFAASPAQYAEFRR